MQASSERWGCSQLLRKIGIIPVGVPGTVPKELAVYPIDPKWVEKSRAPPLKTDLPRGLELPQREETLNGMECDEGRFHRVKSAVS